MVDSDTLKFLLDIGSNGFLIYLVLRLLARLDNITDRLLPKVIEVQVKADAAPPDETK